MAAIWPKCLRRLEEEVEARDLSLWLKPLQAREDANQVCLYAPNGFVFETVRERFATRIAELIAYFSDGALELRLEQGSSASRQPTSSVIAEPSEGSAGGDAGLDSRYQFDNFVQGKSNAMARAAAMQVAERPGASDLNPLLLYGGTGLGKTHLMHAIGHALLQRTPRACVRYVRAEGFVSGMIHALRHGSIDAFKARYRGAQLLMLDDIQFFAGKNASQEEFFHTFNAVLDAGQQIVLTCDRYPKEVEGLEPRLKSRVSWGLSVPIEPPDFETRVAILMEKGAAQGFQVPEPICSLIARRVPGNIRDLEGALNTLVASARFSGQAITLAFTQQTLRDLLTAHERLVSIPNIQRVVCEYYKLRASEMSSRSRVRSIARPRQMAMALSKELTDHSYPEIGEAFGGRDHTTVLHACRTMLELRETQARVREDWERLLRLLTT